MKVFAKDVLSKMLGPKFIINSGIEINYIVRFINCIPRLTYLRYLHEGKGKMGGTCNKFRMMREGTSRNRTSNFKIESDFLRT
jgi:hypothetical protein